MAYITKAEVQALQPKLKVINQKYGVKATFSGSNSSTLTLTVQSGKVDFIGNYIENLAGNGRISNAQERAEYISKVHNIQVNHYYLQEAFSCLALEYLEEVKAVMLENHWDKSDSQTDYFCCSYFVGIDIGRWNKGYVLVS
jgi:hypothetical protein